MISPGRSAELRSALMAWRREDKAVRDTAAERPEPTTSREPG
jgi:hypothetical protein